MIIWDVVETSDSNELHVWMFDSDPESESPDQIISNWGSYDERRWPEEVLSTACWNEVAAAWPNLGQREIRILGEAALEKIERR